MNYLSQVPIGETFKSPFGQTQGPADLVSIILFNSMVVASLILLVMLIFGGFSIIMGAGNNNPEQAAKGKKAASGALIGFIVIFAAYWIIRIVETLTGVNILSPNL